MLEDYCKFLSDEAQLKIALRLAKLALPVWDKFYIENPDEISKLNNLINSSTYVQGGAKTIDLNFPARTLEKIERSYEKAKKKTDSPLLLMKSDATLSPLLATCMQPLTNPEWDQTLSHTVKLVFTSIWNILSWILLRRNTDANETHIYVAINQTADVLMSEKIREISQINEILSEYSNDIRKQNEDSAWEKAAGVKKNEPLETDEVYRKIIGEKIVKDASGKELAEEILRQMREEEKSYWDEWEEYISGTCNTYSFNKEEQSFWFSEIDVIVGSFFNEYAMTEKQMLDFVSQVSLSELRDSGFEI